MDAFHQCGCKGEPLNPEIGNTAAEADSLFLHEYGTNSHGFTQIFTHGYLKKTHVKNSMSLILSGRFSLNPCISVERYLLYFDGFVMCCQPLFLATNHNYLSVYASTKCVNIYAGIYAGNHSRERGLILVIVLTHLRFVFLRNHSLRISLLLLPIALFLPVF